MKSNPKYTLLNNLHVATNKFSEMKNEYYDNNIIGFFELTLQIKFSNLVISNMIIMKNILFIEFCIYFETIVFEEKGHNLMDPCAL